MRWFLLLLGIGAFFLLARLDNGRLWQDEAETAVLGKNTLMFGYPRAFDGVNRLNPSLSVHKNFAWTYHSWLPMYIAAGSFALFGADTWSARFPFALIGLCSIWLTYLLTKRLLRDPLITQLTVLSLVLCVPFLLHMRQCRYYAPAVFGTLWTILAYWRFLQNKHWAGLELAAALTLLFHSDHGVFAPILATLTLDFLSSRPPAAQFKRGGKILFALILLTVPWILYLDTGQHHKTLAWKEISHHFQFSLRQINHFLLPLFLWGILTLAWRAPFRGIFAPQRRAWRLIGWIAAVGFLFLILAPEQRHFRYLLFLIPFILMVQATLLAAVIRARAVLGIGLALVLLLTDAHYAGPSVLAAQIRPIRAVLSSPDAQIRSLPLEFIGELTHPYRGPIDAVVEQLQKEARPGQTLKAPYEEHPILFYVPGLVVEPVRSPEDFERETYPDWILLRRDWVRQEFTKSRYYEQIKQRYAELVLDAPDIPWQNRPDPGYHKFRTDDKTPPVVLFRRER